MIFAEPVFKALNCTCPGFCRVISKMDVSEDSHFNVSLLFNHPPFTITVWLCPSKSSTLAISKIKLSLFTVTLHVAFTSRSLLEAVIVVVPVALPATMPSSETVAIAPSSDFQVAVSPSMPFTVKVTVLPFSTATSDSLMTNGAPVPSSSFTVRSVSTVLPFELNFK